MFQTLWLASPCANRHLAVLLRLGFVFAALYRSACFAARKRGGAIPIPRCSENVVVAACEDVRNIRLNLIERNCRARDALLTARRCANLFASASRADFELRLLTQQNKNVQPRWLP
ncbi:hypothetical protein XH98_18460 [Bradyrhizobium sp. CCBAU 51745]|nr:hypothetical protein [Bradyrhizobium sp. CCBAU 45384]MDA9441037.1 hypothetical protein [Bradyrhizobium sp. CCBAU 51745]